ncbi:hypothetical protein NPA31_007290 [Aurantimonas sp. MSK8Z-1]|uniref:hypothetical protein n=1 Tax=Mangrovibrevibacter kandeliae TaxID=2968473 RepID=UPI002119AC57|nr:hypothetical protein [Aurantimonas sp. MSK8Z-1]MCW4114766.1 hypothetical protein [Aurantimonas sp. MSK8Z-1]
MSTDPIPPTDAFGVGRFAIGDLPAAMQAEAARLVLEVVQAECPGIDHAAARAMAATRLQVTSEALRRLLAAEPEPHRLDPERLDGRGDDAGEGVDGANHSSRAADLPDPPALADPGLIAFAQVHLVAESDGAMAVKDAYATYAGFARRRGGAVLPRSNFGAWLATLARRCGGARDGETVTGLALKGGTAAPAHEALTAAPPPRSPAAPRALPLPLGIAARPRRRVIDVPDTAAAPRGRTPTGDNHGPPPPRRPVPAAREADAAAAAPPAPVRPAGPGPDAAARPSPPGAADRGGRGARLRLAAQRPSDAAAAPPAADPASASPGPAVPPGAETPLDRFLAERLIEAPGFVVSLEALWDAAEAEGLAMHDLIERAKARGHAIRRNAWGPDFLTDAQLRPAAGAPAREAAE